MGKKRKRSRKKRKLKRLNESFQEMVIRVSKIRGGRSVQIITNNKKYNRKRDKYKSSDCSDDFFAL